MYSFGKTKFEPWFLRIYNPKHTSIDMALAVVG
jgi:ABC-type cobalt transport system substrate-binding protein